MAFRHMNPREARRMMDRMGINATEMPGIKEVIMRTEDKELVIINPIVTALNFQGQKMYQIIGERMEERSPSPSSVGIPLKPRIPDEDVQLVATQASVSVEEAKKALEETSGDLAQAILVLHSRKR